MVESGRLVVFGAWSKFSQREWIRSATYSSVKEFIIQNSELNAEKNFFGDVQIYPVLHAPNVVDLIHDMSLKDVFWQFVLCDPEVQALASEAIQVRPSLEQVYVKRNCAPYRYVWPFRFDFGALAGGLSKGDEFYDSTENPPEVQAAADVVCRRFEALLELLRNGKIEAVGIPSREGKPDRVPTSVWSRDSYYFSATNGEILKTKDPEPSDWFHKRLKRWSAVMLRRPQSPVFHVKPLATDGTAPTTAKYSPTKSGRRKTVTQASIEQAIKTLWPNGIPPGLPVKTRNQKIRDWQKTNDLAETSEKSIERYLKTNTD